MPLLADIAAHGLGRALESGRADHERRSVVQAWIAAGTREEPANTATRSAGPTSRDLLTRSDSPDVRQHLAIIKLIDDIPPDGVFEIIAHPASAADAALEAVEVGDLWLRRCTNGPAGWSAETNVPRSDRKRQVSCRYGHRPPAQAAALRERRARRGLPRRRS